jgi:hypothetical protein
MNMDTYVDSVWIVLLTCMAIATVVAMVMIVFCIFFYVRSEIQKRIKK